MCCVCVRCVAVVSWLLVGVAYLDVFPPVLMATGLYVSVGDELSESDQARRERGGS